jgi:hypothetical protein
MQKSLHEFAVHLKRGPARTVRAYCCTLSPEDNKVCFHKKPDASDRASFFVLSSVEGIDEAIPEEADEPGVTVERARAFLELVKQRAAEGVKTTENGKRHKVEE